MKVYFVIFWKDTEIDKIERRFGEKELFKVLQDNKETLISVYEGNCVLDWS